MPSSTAHNTRVSLEADEVTWVANQNLGANNTPLAEGNQNLSVPMKTTRHHSMSESTMHSNAQSSSIQSGPPSRGEGSINALAMAANWDPEEALRPDPGTESDFVVNDNPFAFSPGQLNKLLDSKCLPAFAALGGLAGIARGLRTDLKSGLSIDEITLDGKISLDEAVQGSVLGLTNANGASSSDPFSDRIRVYGVNRLPVKKTTSLLKLIWQAYNDKILILLTIAAAISLALGLYETLGVEHAPGSPPAIDWVEGLAICIAIIIVVLVGAVNDYQKERAFVRLNTRKEDREVKVIRSGKSIMLDIHEILVGDVVHLEPRDIVPADGIFISGHSMKCDESSATGESDQMKKTGGDEVMNQIKLGNTDELDPFIISGSKVLEGVGTFVVTSSGVNSSFGEILIAMRQDMETTPLQVKLNSLASAIAKLGSSAAILLFVILTFRFIGTLSTNSATAAEKGSQFIDILIIAVTVVVVAVPEGLPLAVTLALAFATTRLLKQNNLVRVLKSCETMGNATTICSDKTGTLTTNEMTVVTGIVGNIEFDDKDRQQSNVFGQTLDHGNKKTLRDSIALNSTAFEEEGANFIGSKTETALLSFARKTLGMGPVTEERSNANIVQMMPFDSSRKYMGTVQKIQNNTYRLLVKGAPEILPGYCSTILISADMVDLIDMHHERIERIEKTIDGYAKQSLRTIAFIYRDYSQWPPYGCAGENGAADMDLVLKRMTFLGVFGIQDPVLPGVPEAVAKCQQAGVTVRMVTGDNLVTARAIATECGIYKGGLAMEGPAFRKLRDEDMKQTLPKLQVLARSSPEDKRLLVTKLREMGGIVAVTGDGTNDGPALKAADIGFVMGIAGTEVAKEASAIILMDDNFASILTALMWGRAVNDAVRKFLQFQITVNITAVIITSVSALANPGGKPVLTAVQLLWINLIMDSLAALALATDPPTEEILDRKPAARDAPLISITMWKMIIGQATFQLVVTFVLYFGGPKIFGNSILGTDPQARENMLNSIIFNTFVWMQIFNMYNNRRLDNRFHIFQNVHKNWLFIATNLIMVGGQIMITFIGGSAFSITRIMGIQWAICLVLGALCLPWAVVVRLFPDSAFLAISKVVGKPIVFAYDHLSHFASSIKGLLKAREKSDMVTVV